MSTFLYAAASLDWGHESLSVCLSVSQYCQILLNLFEDKVLFYEKLDNLSISTLFKDFFCTFEVYKIRIHGMQNNRHSGEPSIFTTTKHALSIPNLSVSLLLKPIIASSYDKISPSHSDTFMLNVNYVFILLKRRERK